MVLEDLLKESIEWLVYEDRKDQFSAIKIDNVKIIDDLVPEKYAKIIGKHLLIRKDYFSFDNDESIFYEYTFHIKNGIVLSKEEFENKYLDKIIEIFRNHLK